MNKQPSLFLLLCIFAFASAAGCCDMRSAQEKLNKKLDAGDVLGAIKSIDDPCVSKIPHMNTTKAMLIYRLSMNEKNNNERARLRAEAIRLLKVEAADGCSSAMDILESYNQLGEAYFATFPWGGLLGPSVPIGQPRIYQSQ